MSGEKESTPEARDGLTGDPERDPAAKLLLEAPIPNGQSLLLIEGGCGRLAAHFSPGFNQTLNQNMFFRNHSVSQDWLAETKSKTVTCILGDVPRTGSSTEYLAESFDEIVFRLGRGTALVNAALIESFRLLRRGGSLWVSGHTQEGIKSFAKRAETHFGNVHLIRIKSSCRLLRFQKHTDESPSPIDDPLYFEYFDLKLELEKGKSITYGTKPGIFSYRSTDIGTALLAKHIPDCTGLKVLDLGCGSGVVSLVAFERGAKSVLALDVNAVAVTVTSRNFYLKSLSGIGRCTNLTEGVEEEFDLVLSNPPFHHGSETDFSFPGKILDAIAPTLQAGGSVYLVANRFLDYLTPAKGFFQSSEILAREQGYCVYHFVK